MNTQWLVYALEVEKTASISQAADRLFISQPSLSKAMRDLEHWLGFEVFERNARGVVPTAAGARFLEAARHITA